MPGQSELIAGFDFDLSDRESWVNYAEPPHDPAIIKAIEAVAPPVSFRGESIPRFRCYWGGQLQEYCEETEGAPAGWYYRKHLCFVTKTVGYQWRDPDDGYIYHHPVTGELKRVKLLESVPANLRLKEDFSEAWHRVKRLDSVPRTHRPGRIILPIIDSIEIGLPRWVIEQFRFPEEPGFEWLNEPQYCEFHVWQGTPIDHFKGFGPYVPLDWRAVELVRGAWHQERHATKGERAEFLAEQRAANGAAAQAADDANWNDAEMNEESRRLWEQAQEAIKHSVSDDDLDKRLNRIINNYVEQQSEEAA